MNNHIHKHYNYNDIHKCMKFYTCSAVVATMAVSNTVNVYRITKAQKGGVAKLVDAPVDFPKVRYAAIFLYTANLIVVKLLLHISASISDYSLSGHRFNWQVHYDLLCRQLLHMVFEGRRVSHHCHVAKSQHVSCCLSLWKICGLCRSGFISGRGVCAFTPPPPPPPPTWTMFASK